MFFLTGQSGDSRVPQEALQKLIAEVAECVLSVKPSNSASDTSSASLPAQSALFSNPTTSAEPSLEAHNQSIKSIKEQAKSTDVTASKAGEILDAVVVEDSNQKSERTVQKGDSDKKIDSYAPLNKQFVQALRLLHQQGRYVTFFIIVNYLRMFANLCKTNHCYILLSIYLQHHPGRKRDSFGRYLVQRQTGQRLHRGNCL